MNKALTYVSFPAPTRTPDRLSTIASLFGACPTPITNSLTLDIGCGQGWDILSLASAFPTANFIGLDISEEVLNLARKTAKDLDLNNITFYNLDITKLDDTNVEIKNNLRPNSFDYIICHGLYSWVSEINSKAILKACNELLKDNGLAYISFNSMPAWSTRAILCQALRQFTAHSVDKLIAAREAIDFIYTTLQDYPTPYSMSLRLELENIKKSSDGFILQELLSDHSHAEYLQTFVAKAKAVKLYYVADAKIERTVSKRLTEIKEAKALCKAVEKLPSQLEQEQALDFIFPTWLRQAIVSKKELTTDKIAHELLPKLYIASPLVPSHPDDPEGGNDTFMSPAGIHVQITNKNLYQAIYNLNMTWPDWITVVQLYKTLSAGSAYSLEEFSLDLIPLFYKGVIELHSHPQLFSTTISNQPKIFKLALLQAKQQNWVTNLKFEYSTITDFERQLIPLLNGENNQERLCKKMQELIESGELNLKDDFKNTDLEIQQLVKYGIEEALNHFKESGLLVQNL